MYSVDDYRPPLTVFFGGKPTGLAYGEFRFIERFAKEETNTDYESIDSPAKAGEQHVQ